MKQTLEIFLCACTFISSAQVKEFYNQDFENGRGSFFIITTFGGGSNNNVKDTTDLFTGGGKALAIENTVNQNEIIYLEFPGVSQDSLRSYNNVELHFDLISQFGLLNRIDLEYSIDNRNTWQAFNSNQYLGNSLAISNSSPIRWTGSYYPDWVQKFFNLDSTISDSFLWKHEGINIKSVVSSSNTSPIYIRFKIYTPVNIPNALGNKFTFLDNIKLVGSTCGPVIPRLKPVPALNNGCNGFTVTESAVLASGLNFQFNLDMLGQTNIDSLFLEVIEIASNTRVLYNHNQVTGTLSAFLGTTPGDYKYRIKATNTCGGIAYYPTKGFKAVKFNNLFANCGTSDCLSGIKVYSKFPFVEGFDASPWFGGVNRGSFATAPGENWFVDPPQTIVDKAFCVRSWNATENVLIAPAKATLKNGGNNYLLFRNDIPGNNTLTAVISPCIDLRNDSNMVLTLNYHSTGPGLDDFEIRIRNLTAGDISFTTVLDLNYNNQKSGHEPFRTAIIPLNAYAGSIIQVRIMGRTLNIPFGENCYAAIDNFGIRKIGANDVVLNRIVSENINVCSTSFDTLAVEFFTLDTTLTQLPIAYVFNNVLVQDTIALSPHRNPTDTLNVKISLAPHINPIGNNTMRIWHTLPNDPNTADDTLRFDFITSSLVNTFPYLQDFENLADPNLVPTWRLIPQNNSVDALKLSVVNGIYNSDDSGPVDGTGFGSNYLSLIRGSATTSLFSGYEVSMESSCLDMAALTNPTLDFDYFLVGQNDVNIEVEYSTDGSTFTTLKSLNKLLVSGNNVKSQSNWRSESVSLNAIKSNIFKLRIRFSYPQTTQVSKVGVAIDNVHLFDKPVATDIGIYSIKENYKGVSLNGLTTYLTNNTASIINTASAQLYLSFTPICGGQPKDTTFTETVFLGGFQSAQRTFSGFNNFNLAPGEYLYKAAISVSGDLNASNDSTDGYFNVYAEERIPYFNDFENCQTGLNSVGDYGTFGINKQIAGTSITFPYSGLHTISTYKLPSEVNSSMEALILPAFTGFDSISDPVISFYHRFLSPGGIQDTAKLEMNIGGGWINVTAAIGTDAINWYPNNNKGFIVNVPQYQKASIKLPQLSNFAGLVRFRFIHINGSGNAIWNIDDFKIEIPAQNSVSPVNVVLPAVVFANKEVSLKLNIQNSGSRDLSKCNVQFFANGVPWFNDSLILGNPLSQGQIFSKSFVAKLPTSILDGTVTIKAITSLPNGEPDNIPVDDTLVETTTLFTSNAPLGQCLNFEFGGNPIVSNTANIKHAGAKLWINGSPNKASINIAGNGARSLITGTNSTYQAYADEAFYINPFLINNTVCYELSFTHYFITEPNFDGGTVEYSVDSGATWLTLGERTSDSLWFNTENIFALELIKSGFTGNSGKYIPAAQKIQFNQSGLVYFRFRFKSNFNAIVGEGWAIDDICFEALSKCADVGMRDLKNLQNLDIHIYPNPFSNSFVVSSNLKLKIDKVQLFESSGKLLIEKLVKHKTVELNTELLPAGIYQAKIYLDNGIVVNKSILKN